MKHEKSCPFERPSISHCLNCPLQDCERDLREDERVRDRVRRPKEKERRNAYNRDYYWKNKEKRQAYYKAWNENKKSTKVQEQREGGK